MTNADAGGNCVKATGFDSGQPNLHSVWDTPLVERNEAQNQPGPMIRTSLAATAILAEFQDELTVGGETDVMQIAAESFALAKNEIYPKTLPKPVPVIDHFVDLRPDECRTKAPMQILSRLMSTAQDHSTTMQPSTLSASKCSRQAFGSLRS